MHARAELSTAVLRTVHNVVCQQAPHARLFHYFTTIRPLAWFCDTTLGQAFLL